VRTSADAEDETKAVARETTVNPTPLDHLRTLLLDSSYRPIKIITWQRAVTLCLYGQVSVVESYDRMIRSPNMEMALPAVIALRQYIRMRPFRIRFSKRNVFARDGHTCQYCGCMPGASHLTLDHVVPQSRGGKSTWENSTTACEPCNHRKADRTPEEAGMVLRTKPFRPVPTTAGLLGSAAPPPQWEGYLATG
jgi:5-methylcytosine-specific restriction endonuclease McrA